MINREINRLTFGDMQEGPFQLLADLEEISAEVYPREEFPHYGMKNSGAIERSYVSTVGQYVAPDNVTLVRKGEYELICSKVPGRFVQASVPGVCYLGEPALTGLIVRSRTAFTAEYWSLVYKSEVFAAIPEAASRLAKAFFGTDNFSPPPTSLLVHVEYAGIKIDNRWMSRPKPFAMPMKDMSAFDEGIYKLYGRARAAHLLQELK